MKHDSPKYKQGLGFLDIIFNMVMAYAFLFVLSFYLINKPAKDDAKINSKAEAMIVMSWPDWSAEDIDVWLLLPNGDAVYFQHKNNNLINLERDDRGLWGDIVYTGTSQSAISPLNREVIMFRALIPGTYQVNVHYYSKGTSYPSLGQQPSAEIPQPPYPVKVELIKLNPSYKEIAKREVVITEQGEEKSVFGFTISPAGEFTNVNEDERLFILQKASK